MDELTFKPLKRGRYRCNQTGVVMTRNQILAYVSSYLANGHAVIVNHTHSETSDVSKPAKKQKHPSKYRTKHT